MRRFGLLAVLTLGCMLTFSAVAIAATADPLSTDPASQSSQNNGTGVNTDGKSFDGNAFSGQSYRMDTADPSKNGTQDGGNNGTDFNSTDTTTTQYDVNGIKYDSPGNNVIHSSYTKTSDACASCHTVHNSVNQGALLQWEDPQTACWACHDGTVAATYDVVTGTHSAGTQVNSAGLFGIGDEQGLSNHGMSPKEAAFVTTAAAPGGAEVAEVQAKNADGTLKFESDGITPVMTDNVDKNGNWNTEFTCIACHDPHGTFGNGRILNPNVNGYANAKNAEMTKVTDIYQTLTNDTNATTPYTVYLAPKGKVIANVTINGLTVPGAPQKATVKDNTVTFAVALKDTDVVRADYKQAGKTIGTGDGTTLEFPSGEGYWMSGHGVDPVIYVDGVAQSKTYKIDYLNGKVVFNAGKAPADKAVVSASYFPGLIVDIQIATGTKLTSTEKVKYVKGINQFCGACHTDYNNEGKTSDVRNGVGGAYGELLGEYRQAYRHSVGFTRTGTADANSLVAAYPGLKFDTSNPRDPLTAAPTVDCLTCHYAHGTSDDFIKDSLTQLNQISNFDSSLLYTYDNSRTSALKRLPNMGVCQACHNKSGVAPTATLK